jgi:outer membrane protein TolC
MAAQLALAAGCVRYVPRPLDAAATAAELQARNLGAPDLRHYLEANGITAAAGSWPLPAWDLDELTLAAFYFHPDLDVARAQWSIARAGVVKAAARPNPTLSLGAERAGNGGSAISPWTLGFSFDLPIETAGKRGLRVERASAIAESGRLQIASVAWQVRSRLRSRLVDFFASARSQELLVDQHRLQSEIVTMLEKRLAVGEVSLLDANQARIARAQTDLLLRDSLRRGAEARAAVAQAIGVPLTALDDVALVLDFVDHLPDAGALAATDLRTPALTGRADLLALLADHGAAEAALQLEVARQYPDVRVGPGFTWDQGVKKWALGLSATLPLFDRNRGPIAEAEARRSEVAARVEALQAKVSGDLERALAGYREAVGRLDTASELLVLAERQSGETRRRLAAGETDRLDLRTRELEATTISLSRLDAWIGVQQAVGALEDALERPLTGARIDLTKTTEAPRSEEETP